MGILRNQGDLLYLYHVQFHNYNFIDNDKPLKASVTV